MTAKKDKTTVYVKEFEASVQGKTPTEAFGKDVDADGYRLQTVPLPKHALWMLGRMSYHVPGTANDSTRERDTFLEIVMKHGECLPGKPGNYRIAKFPGTETLLFKTKFTYAFEGKPWYPTTYVLPLEENQLMEDIRLRGDSPSNMWICKPRNDYGGAGICVFKGTDPLLRKEIFDEDGHSTRSVIQRYLWDPLLIGGYKFHMRIHMCITSIEPLEAFVQENGQALFATKPYKISDDNLGANFDPPVHVTNMCLNATAENKENFFTKKPVIGIGQQIRIRQLMSYLAETIPDFDKKLLWQQVLAIASDTVKYIAKGVKRQGNIIRDRHFEMFGMDLMLDKNLKVWMCEVNTDPGMSYPDEDVLGDPNPDFKKETGLASDSWHDMLTLLGLDAGKDQSQGSLSHWYTVPGLNPSAK